LPWAEKSFMKVTGPRLVMWALHGAVGRGLLAPRRFVSAIGRFATTSGPPGQNRDTGVVDDGFVNPAAPLKNGLFINWYPGHIAKAERNLREYLKRVDVVVETRDIRIAQTTAHPSVGAWTGTRPRLVVFTFADLVPSAVVTAWRQHEERNGVRVFFIDAKRGDSNAIRQIREAMRHAGKDVNEARARKGVQPRAARAAVIGFPNVGKSALINKLAGRKAAKTENKAGVTRSMNWVRAERAHLQTAAESAKRAALSFELLDSPGIIPAKQIDQDRAARLAMCGDIGEASYDATIVAKKLLEELTNIPANYSIPTHPAHAIRERYDLGDPRDPNFGDFEVWIDELVWHAASPLVASKA